MPRTATVDISEFEVVDPRRKCKVAHLDLTADQRAKLTMACDTKGVSTLQISTVLGRWGHPTSTSVIARHRKGLCPCAD